MGPIQPTMTLMEMGCPMDLKSALASMIPMAIQMAISLETGFDLPAKEIPIFLINGTLLGAIWGVLRLVSGSIVVPAVSHAVWNAIDYPLFGFGEKVGALGIEQTQIYGPEVGILGIALNLAFLTLLWRIYATRVSKITPDFH